jgi:hypothetical protein
MKRFFIKQTLENKLDAGPKAKLDTYKTLEGMGFEPIIFVANSKYKLIRYFRGVIIILKILKLKNSFVLIENPIDWKFLGVATRIMRLRKNHLILLIHDIESERYKHYPASIEYSFINTFDSVIAHNESMKAFLSDKINKNIKIYTLDMFDYLLDSGFKQNSKKIIPANFDEDRWQVVFCGNLTRTKSAFIYAMADIKALNWDLNLYGTGIEDISTIPFIKYRNSFSPGNPVISENSNFGLLWDGESINTCNGIWGNYLRLNNPHKLSLYIALNLPIIVWEEAAVAKLVEANGIGFTISSLSDISDKLSALTDKDYYAFCKNLEIFNRKVISGAYLPLSLKQINKDL